MRKFISLALLLLCVSTLAQAQSVNDEKLAQILQRMQARLDEARAVGKFPGATVGFVLPDGRVASVSTGVADLETKKPLKTSDRLLAGSVGKTFVAAVSLKLVEEGVLNLDEKIERWLGNEKWFPQLPNAKEITLRMLLNHSSGIQNHVDNGSFMKAMFKSDGREIKYEELIAYVLNKKPLFAAGKGYNYGDTNYILVGLIVERATGKTLYELIAEKFLKPLKLERTIPSNSVTLPEVSNGYFGNKPVIVGGKFIVNPQWEWAGGGFASTAGDLARWAWVLYSGDVLQKKSLEEMLNSTSVGEGEQYGLGVEIAQSKWGKSYGHEGEFPGYVSDMRFYPKYKIAVAVMVNSDETPGVDKFMASAVDDFAQVLIKETQSRELAEADKMKLQKFAESWLALIDAGKFAESWDALSVELKARYAREKWRDALQPLLAQVGKMKSRKFKSIDYADPVADTVAVDFDSSSNKSPALKETVTLTREKDGQWHVTGYSIH